MEVLLDGRPIQVSRPTLAAALRAGVAAAQSQGRMIVEVRADGEQIPDDMLTTPSDEIADAGTISLISVHPGELVGRTLRDAATALEETIAQQHRASELIQSGAPERAVELLSACFASWKTVNDVAERSAALLSLDLPGWRTPEGEPFGEAIRGLREGLRALRDGLESQDWSGVSDTLSYDLDAQGRLWQRHLRALAAAVSKGAGA